jgi:hypothetical protein
MPDSLPMDNVAFLRPRLYPQQYIDEKPLRFDILFSVNALPSRNTMLFHSQQEVTAPKATGLTHARPKLSWREVVGLVEMRVMRLRAENRGLIRDRRLRLVRLKFRARHI